MNSSKLLASCVLFDLDGTLLDTAPDIANALNAVLQTEGKSPLSYDEIRNSISLGTSALIMLAFGSQQSEADFLRRRTNFLNYYEQNICTDTTLFRVLQQCRFDELRAAQSIQDKTWVEGNGYSLVETHNAVLNALGCFLRASQEVIIHVVEAFGKGITISCKLRLVANHLLTR